MHIIVNAHYNYQLSNEVLEECDKKKLCKWLGCYYVLFKNKILKCFVQRHVFAQSPPGQGPSDKYPVNTSHLSRFV
jgi:hypothetical protein